MLITSFLYYCIFCVFSRIFLHFLLQKFICSVPLLTYSVSGKMRSLKANEQRILSLLIENQGYTFKEIAKKVGLNEVSVRRIHNRLRQENVFSTLNIPNFALLGYKVMIVQRMGVASSHLIETPRIICNFLDQWSNCIDCHETFDGKVIARSVWKSADEFKSHRLDLLKKFGTDWLQDEQIDMIPLDSSKDLLRIDDVSL